MNYAQAIALISAVTFPKDEFVRRTLLTRDAWIYQADPALCIDIDWHDPSCVSGDHLTATYRVIYADATLGSVSLRRGDTVNARVPIAPGSAYESAVARIVCDTESDFLGKTVKLSERVDAQTIPVASA
ncbi:MAG TPA: hypothetical protein VF316_24575 [Polyangiaceae bacterium]